jgi:LDH2 family malate/lactate/ureidoglycolate dehydrogenase
VQTTMTAVEWGRAVDFAARAFEGAGVPAGDARKAADALVDADLHGVTTHGLKNLRNYILALAEGRVNPKAEIRDVGGGAAARVLDGDNGLGHVVGHAGMEKAIALARRYGVGTVFVRGSNHYGASAYWARLPLRHNMVGFAFTNALASMAAWGGKECLVGNNPPAWAVPSRVVSPEEPLPPGEADPAFLDIALSVVAGNRLDIYRRRGQDIPLGWALDADGQPTTDAAARAKGGSFAPIADYKGSGLAIMLSLIASFLAGGPFDDQRTQGPNGPALPGGCSHWFAAYDVAQFTDLEAFTANVRAVQGRVRSTPPRAGFDRVYAPGDLENARARRYRAEGIPLESFVLDDLRWVAETTGISYDIVG